MGSSSSSCSPRPGRTSIVNAGGALDDIATAGLFSGLGKPDLSDPSSEPEGTVTKVLRVVNIDLNVQANVENHHTSEYDLTKPEDDNGDKQTSKLIVRRGETFDVILELNREYNPDLDEVAVELLTGTQRDRPLPGKGTFVKIDVTKGVKSLQDWGASLESYSGKTMTVRIRPSPKAVVARWKLIIYTTFKSSRAPRLAHTHRSDNTMTENSSSLLVDKLQHFYEHPELIYILFNAWCKYDQVYLEDENLRKEYVMNDTGRIFTGNHKQITFRPWTFGQFEHTVLDCILDLLDESKLKHSCKGDPVKVTRTVSAAVNAQDDNGILVGNWSGDYEGEGCSAPTSWTGSEKIIVQYHKQRRPVRYGQCWVFSGLCTTVCRALGIPSRSVTNFSSAHDTDANTTIDRYYKEDAKGNYEKMDLWTYDSIWNFHVWNEAWMARPDLEHGFGGWQAFDATPQELSDGMFQAGPCSVKAVKEGLVNNNYDTAFVFAEVNADIYHHYLGADDSFTTHITKNRVGKHISTKKPNEKERLDVTLEYKYKENTENERAAVRRAGALCKNAPVAVEEQSHDVHIEMLEMENKLVGNDFSVVIKLQNKSRFTRTVHTTVQVSTMFYTGAVHKLVKKEVFEQQYPSLRTDFVVCRITTDEYLHLLKEQASFQIDVACKVEETKQITALEDTCRLRRPDLEIEAPDHIVRRRPFQVIVKFENSMSDPLTKCSLTIGGAGLGWEQTLPQKDMGPCEKVEMRVEMRAAGKGYRTINASFNCKELSDISGSCDIYVKDLQE